MIDNHTREQERHNKVQGLKVVAGGMSTVEGGRRATIKTRMVWQLATIVTIMRVADNVAGSGQRSREGHNNHQWEQ
jgi:hypothetical protein